MKISACSSPKVLYNRYLGREILVPCGVCDSCRLAQGSEWKQRLIEESKLWKYVLFFTLTYKDEYLPTSSILYPEVEYISSKSSQEEIHKYLLHSTVCRHDFDLDKDNKNKLFTVNISDYERKFISEYEKICGENKFPILSRSDAKGFVKVLSRNCQRFCDSSLFRIYLIGEYGSSSFRPHMHGLFFTNFAPFCEEQFSESSLANLVSISWCNMVRDNSEKFQFSFGITDCQKTDKGPRTMSYVSQYLSSITNLPQIFRAKESAPFRYSSKERSVGYVESDAETLCFRFYFGIVSRVVYSPERLEYSLELLPRSYRTRLFVEHRGFNTIDFRHLGAWIIIVSFCRRFSDFQEFLISYDITDDPLSLNCIFDKRPDDHFIDRLKSLYYSLKKAFRLCKEFGCQPCDYGFYHLNFDSNVKLFKLKQFYELQEELVQDPNFDSRFLNCLYFNDDLLQQHPVIPCNDLAFYSDINNCPRHLSERLQSKRILLNSTKTKKRNDFLKNPEFSKFNF